VAVAAGTTRGGNLADPVTGIGVGHGDRPGIGTPVHGGFLELIGGAVAIGVDRGSAVHARVPKVHERDRLAMLGGEADLFRVWGKRGEHLVVPVPFDVSEGRIGHHAHPGIGDDGDPIGADCHDPHARDLHALSHMRPYPAIEVVDTHLGGRQARGDLATKERSVLHTAGGDRGLDDTGNGGGGSGSGDGGHGVAGSSSTRRSDLGITCGRLSTSFGQHSTLLGFDALGIGLTRERHCFAHEAGGVDFTIRLELLAQAMGGVLGKGGGGDEEEDEKNESEHGWTPVGLGRPCSREGFWPTRYTRSRPREWIPVRRSIAGWRGRLVRAARPRARPGSHPG